MVLQVPGRGVASQGLRLQQSLQLLDTTADYFAILVFPLEYILNTHAQCEDDRRKKKKSSRLMGQKKNKTGKLAHDIGDAKELRAAMTY